MEYVKGIKPLKGAEDWPTWKDRVLDVLELFDAVDIVEGKREKPSVSESSTKAEKEELEKFNRSATQAKIVISQCVSDDLHQRISGRLSAKEAWDILVEQFDNKAEDQLFRQCLNFFSMEWDDTEDAPTVISRLKNQHREFAAGLKTRNIKTVEAFLELLFVSKVLHILPKRFESFKSSYLLMKANESKKLEDVSSALILHERNVVPTPQTSKTGDILSATNSRGQENRKPKGDTACKYCSVKGHWIRQCSKWKADGKPPYPARANGTSTSSKTSNGGQKRAKGSQVNVTENRSALISISSDINIVTASEQQWWIDNGATRHITSNLSWFTDYKPFPENSNATVKAAGKEVIKALGSGTIEVANYDSGKLETFTLNDVWYVPDVSRNLVSILAAHDRNPNSRFESTNTECWFSINGQTIFSGTRNSGGTLYCASFHTVQPAEVCAVAAEDNRTLQLYHERWGHMDKRYVRSKLESELGIKVAANYEICEPCQFGKAHRLPFGNRERPSAPGELLSGDVCGPFDPSFGGRRYLIVIKDHYSRYRYCFVAREKSAVKEALREVLANARTIGHHVKEFLSDNGGEFDNSEVRQILREYGVNQRLTAPYTPEQNGAVERENRTIVEMARTFKYANPNVTFPAAIWAELVMTAGYVLNRTGKTTVANKSPFELWFGQKPRIKHLRVVSSKCYIHVPAQKRRKMDKKAVVGYLVGYDGDERYRIYVPERRNIVVSRDVVFHEMVRDCDEKVELPIKIDKINDIEEERKEGEEAVDESIEKPKRTGDIDESSSSESEDAELSNVPATRHSTRERRPPEWLKDYVSLNFAEVLLVDDEPKTYNEAISSEDSSQWKSAMDKEIKSMHKHDAWELTELPPGKKTINNKWVYRIKRNPDGSVDKYRARLVIKGCAQKPGIDYSETFSPVARLEVVRSLLSIAAAEKMVLRQFDVSTAFLYGDVEEEIFMKQPEGYADGSNRVCRLKRSLYGLKQAPRCWNKRFDDFMISLGFRQSREDPCVYICPTPAGKIIVALYVDDGLVAASSQTEMNLFIEQLRSQFEIVAKEVSYFLGLEISQHDGDILVSQSAYIKKIISRFNMEGCKPVLTPIEKLTAQGPGKASDFPYRSVVGALLYVARGTRFDIAYSVSVLSRHLENPTDEDVTRAKRVIRYLAGTVDQKLVYQSKPKTRVLECYSDADFAGCPTTMRSTSGVIIKYAGAAITWLSRRQELVADSTCEAEIIAANLGSKETIWISRLFKELIGLSAVPILKVDNESARKLCENPEFHFRTKHIQRKYLFIRDRISVGMLTVKHIGTEYQLADILTKPIPRPRLQVLCEHLGLSA